MRYHKVRPVRSSVVRAKPKLNKIKQKIINMRADTIKK